MTESTPNTRVHGYCSEEYKTFAEPLRRLKLAFNVLYRTDTRVREFDERRNQAKSIICTCSR